MPQKKTTRTRRKSNLSGNDLPPKFAGFFGKTGCGKSYQLWNKHLAWQKELRLPVLAWSPKELGAHGRPLDDYAGRLRCRRHRDIEEFVIDARKGRSAVFVPTLNRKIDERNYDIFCELAIALAPIEVIADEVHSVTRPNGGVPGWFNVCTIGRAHGVRVLAGTTRPSHVDKEFYNALTYAWCGAQNYEEDAKVTSKLVLVKPVDILTLPLKKGISRQME